MSTKRLSRFQVHVEKPIGLDALIGVVAMLAPKERAVAPRLSA